ncbi:MAG: AAA family ATPase [Candidatus Korarchaeota archaeon]
MIPVKVIEGTKEDSEKMIIRLSVEIMNENALQPGAIVLVHGRKRTLPLKVWPHNRIEKGVMIGGILRGLLGVSLNETVQLEKVEAKEAEKVSLSTSHFPFQNVARFLEFLRSSIVGMPVMKESVIYIQLIRRPLYFVVEEVLPEGIAIITSRTQVDITSSRISVPSPEVSYEDIGGLKDVIAKIREIVELPLKYPELFQRLGVEPPKGIILHGPPGTGKTLIARALANEVNARFFTINGPEIMSRYFGDSERRLRQIFEEAEKNTPAVILIDEIDSIAPRRGDGEREVENRVVAQLLTLMDGIKQRGKIIVIGATNRLNAIDPALRRPGRFDKEIEVTIPDEEGRLEILQIHTRGMPLDGDVDMKEIAALTHGFTGADISALCKEAALSALRRLLPKITEEPSIDVLNQIVVHREDFMNALREVSPSALREIYVDKGNVNWDDIHGLRKVKKKLLEIFIWMTEHRQELKKKGIKLPVGILLYGPPGTGKTTLVRGLASKTGYNLIHIHAPDLYSKWMGETERALRELFKKARQVAPVIVFIEDVETIVIPPSYSLMTEWRLSNQFLFELEDAHRREGIFVIGVTSRPDLIDPCALRPGRFDTLIYVPPPDLEDRIDILKALVKDSSLTEDDINEIAHDTEGYSHADLDALYQRAAIISMMEGKELQKNHFYLAMEDVPPSINQEMLSIYKQFMENRYRREMFRISAMGIH